VWASFDDGDHWQSLQLNLPHTAMRDLWIHDTDLIVATHGRSFWVLDDVTPLRQISDTVVRSSGYLFQPRMAYRVQRDTNTDTPLPPDEPAGENPPDGATIDYFLGAPASGPVMLEVLDAAGRLVRGYSSADQPEASQADLAKTVTVPLYWLRPAKSLSADTGMHRWVWDLRYPPPKTSRHGYPIAAIPHDTPRLPLGPGVVPGDFTVRLTVNGRSYTQPLTVKLDPRLKVSLADLQQQFRLETRLASLMNSSYEAVGEARPLREQLNKISTPESVQTGSQSGGSTGESITALAKKVSALLEPQSESSAATRPQATLTAVSSEANTLYREVDRADAAPTASQEAAAAEVERESAEVLRRWNSIKTSDLPALNRQLRGAGLPEIRIQSQPQPEEPSEDLE
jgi:hypothetical protein